MAKNAKATAEKVDFRKLYPELYRQTRSVTEVRAAKGTFLAIEGVGAPGGEEYQQAIQALYTLAYTTKFALKRAGAGDFAVPALECLYFDDPSGMPKEEWRWRLQVRIPDGVTAGALAEVRRAIKEKKGIDTSRVKRVSWAEGRALQVLHVGPYDKVGDVYQRLMADAAARGLTCAGAGHEIYLNDPRRVAPEKIKTIVRIPVR
jgi:hypothetical protein